MFENIINEFQVYLSEINNCLKFFHISTELRPRLGKMISWSTLDKSAQNLLNSYMNFKSVQPEIVYSSLYVLVHASFEQFIRNMIETAVEAMSNNVASFDELDEKIVKENIYRTGVAFSTIHQPLDYLKFDHDLFSRNIGTCLPGSADFVLNASAFSFIKGTMTPSSIEKILNRISVSLEWDVIGRDQDLQELLGAEAQVRETAKITKNYLENMVKNRNRIVHTGGAASDMDYSSVEEQIKFVPIFCRTLCKLIEDNDNFKFG